MPPTFYNPQDAARRFEVHSNTIRLWCREFAAFLSPSANPPSGQPRRLTADDLVVLQHVAEMSGQKMPLADIGEVLASMPPADLTAPVIDAEIAPVGVQNAPTAALVAQAVVEAMQAQITPLLAPPTEKQLRDSFVEGVSVGVGATLGVIVVVLLASLLFLRLVGIM